MLNHRDDEPIIALCTPSGAGALALLRLSGTNVRTLANQAITLASGLPVMTVPTHTVHFGRIGAEDNTLIDQIMVIVMDGPRTFTGQDTLEITCHNNPFIIQAIIDRLIACGARQAQEGEFSRRAFVNGKIDLIQAEAIQELIQANTQFSLKQSLAQLEGTFSHYVHTLEQQLVKALAWCEASFEFLDEGTEFGPQIKTYIEQITSDLETLLITYNGQQQIRTGIKIALIGTVNAGKSSLFNTILGQQRSIVTPIAGTTRDVIEAGLYRHGAYWTLSDTAGLRHTQDIVEQEGIERAHLECHKADIILLVVDGSRLLSAAEYEVYRSLQETHAGKIIIVQTKTDIIPITHQLSSSVDISVSVFDADSIKKLEGILQEKIQTLLASLQSPFLLNKRQYSLLITCKQKMEHILSLLTPPIQYELVSYALKDALEQMSEMTGKSVSEAGIDMVFKEFCVGK